ncbi:hypothetical protein GM661_09000 [Iocasia frigidifontis]|uniref:Uncharacterized protein n=1 Tax=Iocasia fonsfrigidae TaxID=2682810 RepID=A0A8A7K8H7_9FIRM|nr:V-type ATPase subunit [Iocasia fonsfrigidae]QTL98103.1 hypothetical protein GM661_09000 [Iocasia fonsfrigidae]
MGLAVQYPVINAKIRALISKMLDNEDYRNIIKLSSVQDIFNYLYNNTYYHDKLAELFGVEIHRRRFESTLKKTFIDDYHVIMRFLKSGSRDFFKQFFAKFEIEDIKMLLRTILIEHDEEYLKEGLIYLGNIGEIDIKSLTAIRSYQDLLTVFEDTIYYNVLNRFADRYERDRNLFPVEMSLDFQYFSRLEELGKKLGGSDYRYIEDLMGTEADLLNIQWIYRIKKYYNLSSGEILNYLIPFHYKINRDNFKKMSQVVKATDMEKYIRYNKYQEVFRKAITGNSDIFGKYYLAFLLKKSIKVKSTSFFNIGNIIAYLIIKECEIRDIITIVEGVRYSLSTDKIKEYLIRDGV